ncbi:hypothetical protein LO762_32055 [Actinocorallia sp. API 0066]|uniref:hypothetical protein n=1 Tax=Actinocorallia sp. API 0066 TaxID=2896846 RepID=UPI001E3F3852|nr:hypothetical protein [Actinocorallia sp. API 0066]MCD0453784.1 hypothetical protein [Actinocorallia sp. API 0066]
MFAERGGGVGKGVGPLDGEVGGEPGTAQYAGLGPDGRREVVLGGEVIGLERPR